MSSADIFWWIGDMLQETFRLLQNDFWLTWVMNTGVVLLGFVGLFIWLGMQNKYNAQAASNPDQLK